MHNTVEGIFNALMPRMRPRTVSTIGVAALTALFTLLHFLAFHFFWYWQYWWYDIVMHGTGGAVLGSMVLWFVLFETSPPHTAFKRLSAVLAVTLIIGVAWEIFEYVVGITRGEAGYVIDTLGDLGMDVAGGLLAYLIFNRYE